MKLPVSLFAEERVAESIRWGQEPLLFDVAATMRQLVTVDEMQGWFECNTLTTPYFSVLKEGLPLSDDLVTSRRMIAGRAVVGHMDGLKVRAQLRGGATLMLNKLEDWHPAVRRICQTLSRQLLCEAGALLFYTAAGHHGAHVHRDPCHVVVIQLAGRKRWHLYNVPEESDAWEPGFPRREERLGEPFKVEVGPGQALYIPLGQAHEAWTESEESLHLSLTLVEPRRLDVVTLALQNSVERIPRHAVIAGNHSQRLVQVADILESLKQALSTQEPAELLDRLEGRFRSAPSAQVARG